MQNAPISSTVSPQNPKVRKHWRKLWGGSRPQTVTQRNLGRRGPESNSRSISTRTSNKDGAISCALIFKHYWSSIMFRPVERESFQVGSEDLRKTCECHPNEKRHTIEECIEFKNAVRYLLDMDNIANSLSEGIIITCDEPQLDIMVTEKTIFYRCSFMSFKKTMLAVYSELVQNRVFTPFYKDVDVLYSLWFEVWKCFPYHNAAGHSIKMCLAFRHDMEYLISIGKIQVEFVPRAWCYSNKKNCWDEGTFIFKCFLFSFQFSFNRMRMNEYKYFFRTRTK